MAAVSRAVRLDLARMTVRQLNHYLHHDLAGQQAVQILNPQGMHSIAAGLDLPGAVQVQGHAGYYLAAMNRQANVTVHGNTGLAVAENMMSGLVRVKGNASQSAGASAHGGLLVIEGDAASRCGISLKGGDIVVKGSVGHVCGFMAQLGHLVVCGDAGAGLGDSLFEAVIYVAGTISGLGADARIEAMGPADLATVDRLLEQAKISADPATFQRVASARTLYHWHAGQPWAYG